jgi:hypothetical protein
VIALLLACSDYAVTTPDPPAPADPQGLDPEVDVGSPPDWSSCTAGWHGVYHNLDLGDPGVEPERDTPRDDPRELSWWEDVAFREFEPSLDLGTGWWPVDEGIGADPLYFAARFTAWVRGYSDTRMEVLLGSEDDAWLLVNGEVVVARPGLREFEPEVVEVPIEAGQFPVELRYAHRAGPSSALRFRVLSGDVQLCYPDFGGG